MRTRRFKRMARGLGVAALLFVVSGVWVTHQFPGFSRTPKSSMELLQDLFQAPVRMVKDPMARVLDQMNKGAVILFLRSCELPAEAEERLVAMVRGERFRDVTVPFVYYLVDLYGAQLDADADTLKALAYEEPPAEGDTGKPAVGLSTLVQQSQALRRHVTLSLRLFDALFLQVPLEIGDDLTGLTNRLDPRSLENLKEIFRDLADEIFPKSDGALSHEAEKSEYAHAIEKILQDDDRLSEFSECLSDFVRDLSAGWLRAFVRREGRKERRLEWVNDRIAQNRYHEIADYARARASRRLVCHIVVDGLQGKLLEGLAQLSSGQRQGSGARYVEELVKLHQAPPLKSADQQTVASQALGNDLLELVAKAPHRPDYLENFKRYFFSPDAGSVVVSVATVDSPTISVRNLPIVYSGHPVAGRFGTGIPNFSFLDRETGRGWYFWGSDALHLQRIFNNQEDEIPHCTKRPEGPGACTLFERLWRYNTVSCMASVDTGAVEKISAEVGVVVGELKRNFIEKIIVLRFRRRAAMERELNNHRRWLIEHRNLSHSFLASLLWSSSDLMRFHQSARFLAEHEDEGIPDYALWYNPWPDHFAHFQGPYSDAIVGYRGEYDRLDFYLGKMVETYESVQTVDGEPYSDRTLFGVVSDHGLIYTSQQVTIETLLFESLRGDGVDFRYQKLTQDEGSLPDIHGQENLKETKGFDAVVGSTAGGSYVIDLFATAGDGDTDDGWRRHPDYHQLRRYRLRGGQTVDFIAELRKRLTGVLDFAVVREYGPGDGEVWPPEIESVVRLVTPDRGEARILRLQTSSTREGRHRFRYRYELLGDTDPLALVASVRDYLIQGSGTKPDEARNALASAIRSSEGLPDAEWRRLLSYTLRPDSVFQLSHLYDSSRAGTVNLFPQRHIGFNSSVPGRHAGETFGEKNGTQLYFGAGLARASLQTARNGSLPVTVYHWLVGDETFESLDPEHGCSPARQFGYDSLLSEAAFAPLR